MHKLIYTSQARRDWKKVKANPLRNSVVSLLALLERDPFAYPPEFESLSANLSGAYSRRINRQHRLVYEFLPNRDGLKDENGIEYDGIVKIISMWTHYAL
jgi:Txe/YoeB family toxin of toxin-antitoxin system